MIAPASLIGASVLAAAIVVAQASPSPSPEPSPTGAATSAAPVASTAPAASSATAAASPTPEPTETPTLTATPVPQPTAPPTPRYAFVYRASPQPIPPSDVPVIAEIDLNGNALTPPSPLHVRVLTSVAVVSVYAQTSLSFMTRSIQIPKAQPGLFLFDGYIPDVPSFVRNHTFAVTFVATAANGTTANVTLPLRLN
jgi:hypothetical protein